MKMEIKHTDADRYIAGFPLPVQRLLQQMRDTILKTAPGAEEIIAYQMPAYRLNGPLVYFAGYKAHIGFYPTGSGIAAFQEELSAYKSAKGSVQFPVDQPLPLALIARIVRFRVKENKRRAEEKKTTTKNTVRPAALKKVSKTSVAKKARATKQVKP